MHDKVNLNMSEEIIINKIKMLLKEVPEHGNISLQVIFRAGKVCRIVTGREESSQVLTNVGG